MKELEAPAGYVKDETPVKIDLGAGIPEKVAAQISEREELELTVDPDGSNVMYMTVSDISDDGRDIEAGCDRLRRNSGGEADGV